MKYRYSIFFLVVSTSIFSQDSLTATDLQETWRLSALYSPGVVLLNKDTPYQPGDEWSYPHMHWLISGNRVYELDDPCCVTNTFEFTTFNHGIFIVNERRKNHPPEKFNVSLNGDSLTVSEISEYGSTYYFLRDSLPASRLEKYQDGWVNPVCLYGDWEIPVGEVSVPYDAIFVWYPWTLPETIQINASNIHRYFANNRFYLEVDGVKRPFKVGSVSLYDEDLILYPGEWVEEYIKRDSLEYWQVANVWLRKTE